MGMTGKITDAIRKYRFVLLILLLGVVLMLIPFGSQEDSSQKLQPAQATPQESLSQQLDAILSKIEGAGEVSVLLTVQTGASAVYQQDEDIGSGNDGGIRKDTVIVTDENRVQAGLVQHVHSEQYRGAIIVCQGADNPQVRLHIIEAVARATGLGTDKISVLKMK